MDHALSLIGREQKLYWQHKIEQYLSNERVYDLMEDLLKSVVVRQPDDPLSFLIDRLSSPPVKKIFLIGPPGFKVREFALQVADHYKLTTISVGDLLKKYKSKKLQVGEEIEGSLKHFASVSDDVVVSLVRKEIYGIQREHTSFVLCGFPKTRVQALSMQHDGVFPDAFIILNLPEDRVHLACYEKFRLYEKTLDRGVVANKAAYVYAHAKEYLLGLAHVKEIYAGRYFYIDCASLSREYILEDVARLLRFKIKNKRPKRAAAIVVVGGDKNKRVRVSKQLAKRYGFVLVEAREQLAEQVARNSEVGRVVLEHLHARTLVRDSIVNGLIQSRLSQVDVRLQGFVLYGFPRTDGQTTTLRYAYLQPTLIVLLEGEELLPSIARAIAENHQSVILKLSSQLPESKIFYKVCFHLYNN